MTYLNTKGPNGKGKTTILESCTPFRTLASRKKALPHHVFLKDSFRELDFDFQGDKYQTRIKIDCDSGKQEGYIWQNGQSIVNGSAREYDKAIERIFGSKDLFFNSIFCAQNAQKLSDLTTAKLKELFSEFLQLNKYIVYEATVKQCLGALSAQATAYDSQVSQIKNYLSVYGDLDVELIKTTEAQAEHKTKLERMAAEIRATEKAIITVKERIAANAAMEDRANDFRQRITDTGKAKEQADIEYEDRVSGIRNDLRKCKTDLLEIEGMLSMKDEIETAVSKKTELNEQIIKQTTALERCQTELAAIRDKIYQHDQTILPSTQPHKRETDIPLLRERIKNAESKAQDLEKRDPGCTSNICSFIVGALQAQGSVKELRAELVMVEREVAEHDRHVETILKKAAEKKSKMQGIEKKVLLTATLLQNRLSVAKVEHDECARRAARHDDLKVALSQKKSLGTRSGELTAQGMKEKATFDAKINQLCEQIDAFKVSLSKITAKIDKTAKDSLAEFEVIHRNKNNERVHLLDQIQIAGNSIQQCRADIEKRTAYQEQIAELSMKQATIQNQISEWTYLRNAVSKDGIRALEIDGVAPSISAYANNILFNTFGPAYSVKLRTQDDDGKETLDILALEEDGRETLLDDLSGGEKVWSLKALRLAMTLISKQQSGKNFQTCLCDEEDGALDAGNSQNFIHMYRAFMDTGKFDDCFFISHRPECVALADHVLEFGNGGISIN